jgi:translation initiation factor 5
MKWTQKDEKYLIVNYSNIDNKTLSKKLKRTEISLRHKAQKLGVKISNLNTLAKAIYLKPNTIMKFWQKKVGCQSKKDILYNKSITSTDLDDLLEELIELLLCTVCSNPEFEVYKEKKNLFIKCQACGSSRNLKSNEDLMKILLTECI